MSVSAVVRPKARRAPRTTEIRLDATSKRSALYVYMAKSRDGGGASRRGSHRMADAGGCQVNFYYADHLKLRAAGGNFYMDYGTLVHTAMAYHYAAQMERKPHWYIECPDALVALEDDCLGNPQWLRNVQALMEWYKVWEIGQPWKPIYCEEEFETTVGTLDPLGEDEPGFDLEFTRADGSKYTQTYPNLNAEIVTCRPDLIVERNGDNFIIDHKTASPGRKDRDRLPIIDPTNPDYKYAWQCMVNLQIVRTKMPIKGFELNRVKREIPFDGSRDPMPISPRMYEKVPATIRASVKKEREIMKKIANGFKDPLTVNPWQCEAGFKCAYTRLCYAFDKEERDVRLVTEFKSEG